MTEANHIGAILMIITLVTAIGCATIDIIENEKEIKEILQDKCKQLGYKELTDQKKEILGERYKIECDNKVQEKAITCMKESECEKTDKWRECTKYKRTTKCY